MEYHNFVKPLATDMKQLTIPYEEKKFITSVGNMSLFRFLHSKKTMDLYPKVDKWDDAAGKDAFKKAKRRFFKEINGGFHYQKDLPWPTYSENTDSSYNQKDLEELYKDWDKPDSFYGDDDETDVGKLGYIVDDPVFATGWDDEEDPIMQGPLRSLMKPIISFA